MTCSQRSCVPKARIPRMCVTLFASQPSVSIDTETTHRTAAPSWSFFPTVFMTSRRRSWSVTLSAARASPVRSMISRRKRSISSAAMARNLGSSASPDSSSSESISSVLGRASGLPVVSSKLRKSASRPCTSFSLSLLVLLIEAGHIVVDQLRDRGVLADDDEAGRDGDTALLPQLKGALIVSIESLERGLELVWKLERVKIATGAASLLGHVLADVLPEVAVDRHLVTGNVFGDRHARQLDDAAFDGIHQREVAHRPGKERAFGVAGATQKERRRREVEDALESERAIDRFESRHPQPRGLVVLLGFLALVSFQRFVIRVRRLLAVAVVRLVVNGQDQCFMPISSASRAGASGLRFRASAALGRRALEQRRGLLSTVPSGRGA